MMKKNIITAVSILFLGSHAFAMDINDAVNQALRDNNSYKKQQYIYEESKENINISEANYKPKFDLSYTYSANKEDLSSLGKDYSNASAIISYNLFNGLSDLYTVKSSKDLADTSKFQLLAAKFDLILLVKENYISYLKSLKNIETMQNAFKLFEQQYRDSENKYEQGLLAKNDLLQVHAQMLQAKQNLARAKADTKIARYNLKNSLGGNLSKDENIVDLAKTTIEKPNYDNTTLDKRSEIRAVKKTIDSLVNLKAANKGNYLPKADLSLSYTKYGDNANLEVDDGSVEEQNTVAMTLSWNLYNGGRDSSQDVIYNKRILQAKEDLADLKLNIKLQYEKADEEFNVSKLNYETAKISLEQSQENYKIVNNRFKEGLSSSTDLINANYLLTEAKQSFHNAYYDRFLAKATLDRIFEK
jgi:outer membrane protein